MNRNLLRTSLHFHNALAILEPQSYIVKQFGAENISLLSGRLVSNVSQKSYKPLPPKHFPQSRMRIFPTIAFHPNRG